MRNLFDAGATVDDRTESVISERFFNERIIYFTDKFRTLDLDILCLQEVGGEQGVSLLGDALGYSYFFARPNKRGIRMAVLYKKELASRISCESISFGELAIPSIEIAGDTHTLKPISQRRDILEITLTTAGKSISISTFHLKSNLPQYLEGDDIEHNAGAHVDAKFRCILYKTMELCALKRFVNKKLIEGKEVVLLGDFNENNTASMMDILRSAQQDDLRLWDVLSGYAGDATTHIHRGGRLTFDTILLSEGLRGNIRETVVENKDLADCSTLPLDEEVIGSDHALVWVEIEV